MDTQDAAALPAPALPTTYRKLPRMQELGLLIVILILGLVLSVYGFYDAKRIGGTNTFLNLNNLIGQIATYMAVYAIMAVGQTLVIITGGIDISVGSIFALAAMICADVTQRMDYHSPATKAILAAFGVSGGVGLLCGWINGI